jgi:hypothetical protein
VIKAIILIISICGTCYAESKIEVELRAQLAESKAAFKKASDERAALQANLAKLANNAKASSASQSASTLTASDLANYNAQQALATAQRAASEAAAAATAAASAASSSKTQNNALMITQAFGFLAVLVGLLFKVYTDRRDRKWLKEDADAKANKDENNHRTVLTEIAGAKDAAHAAYIEANSVNMKIASIGLEAKDGKPLKEHGG